MKWLAWLRPGVDETDPAPAPEAEETLPEAVPADEPTETDAPAADEPAPERADSAQDILRRLDRRTADLERRQPAAPYAAPEPARAPPADPDFQAEEAQLARAQQSGLGESDLAWMRWQIEQNRANRETRRIAERTASEARDYADRADFSRLEFTDPELYRSYAPRVEKVLAEARARGQPSAPRGAVLRLLMGDDLINRKQVKRPTRTPASPAASVERRPLPRARSDVQARANQSERDARRRRLEGKQI